MSHKYTQCDIFLTWGPYFVEKFKANNSAKNVKIISFGNSIYNKFDRSKFSYKENKSNKILLLPTALDKENILFFGATAKSSFYFVCLRSERLCVLFKKKRGNLKLC